METALFDIAWRYSTGTYGPQEVLRNRVTPGPGDTRLRLYRGIYVGLRYAQPAEHYPMWWWAVEHTRGDSALSSHLSKAPTGVQPRVSRDFLFHGRLPQDPQFEAWVGDIIRRWLPVDGVVAADALPLELHAIDDPEARRAAYEAFRMTCWPPEN